MAKDISTTETGPDPVDLHIGGRIRSRRRAIGMSQEVLAAQLGLTFQQVQKYERGANRVSGSKLYAIAKALGVRVQDFYEGLADTVDGSLPEVKPAVDFFSASGSHDLAENYVALPRPLQKSVVSLARNLRTGAEA